MLKHITKLLKRRQKFILYFIIFIFFSCNEKSKNIDTSKIHINFDIIRFEKIFFESPISSFKKIKSEYSFFFPQDIEDSVWKSKMVDPYNHIILKQINKVWEGYDFDLELSKLFKHIKYYFPNFKLPDVYTYISDFDYENRIILSNGKLFVALDLYLGSKSEFYQNRFPRYIAHNMDRRQFLRDIAYYIARDIVPLDEGTTFLDKAIYNGKLILLIDYFLPKESNDVKMGYETKKNIWIENNEKNVWKYFVNNRILYSTNTNIHSRFFGLAPFSKFYLDIDNKTPGQVGVWIGWKILISYLKNNDVSIDELIRDKNNIEIFKKSKYKPYK